MVAIEQLAHGVGIAAACEALGVPRASYYRYQARAPRPSPPVERPRPPLALSETERQQVLEVLHSERFVDQAPPTVYATLLDEGRYLCSVRTMYRILAEADEVRERRNQLQRPSYAKPELLATGPNQVWSWDITKLKGPEKWTYFYLYVILDIFSRYVVGWMLAQREAADLAKRLIADSCEKQAVDPDRLTLHADRGPSMTSKPVAQLLADLGVTKTHSRPSVSNDNPYSEAQFKTLKYRPDFPERFGGPEHGRQHCQTFFHWYNTEHYHSGIALLTPETVHYGLADAVLAARAQTLQTAFLAHPERFKGRLPQPLALPKAVWINPPDQPGQDSVQPQEDLQ
jgi:putative transposase